ncbi:DUF885 family protein [Sphingomonas sp. BT-65]|uniref:DUF885 domain-containing protein n=1 Tax=Sphingomonas sp. BT-65 TaxID=2989821 RepID=UPI002235C0F9|nr:DUF885 family protein [Sphingomonas sp. BT-65]MCW4461317.1 DUF885 family protein [Sphingomonas sp. BT-65]
MRTTRRQFLATTATLATLPALPAFARGQAAAAGDAAADKLLTATAEQLLENGPESATSLGIDKGERAHLRSKLEDRSIAGKARVAEGLRKRVAELKALDPKGLSPVMRTNVDAVTTAFRNALDGFAFPYGDVAVGGWRNSPYVVVQNVGGYLDIPRFLDTEHKVENAADAASWLARFDQYAGLLDGETERLKVAYDKGVIAPDFLLDKCLKQIALTRGTDAGKWELVTNYTGKPSVTGSQAAEAARIAAGRIAPALDRQIEELKRHRTKATSHAGVWKFPDGEAYYAWALRAGTTTTMTPDEVHKTGQEELKALQAEMDVILRKQGFTQGTVGARMTALGKDPRFLFPDNDAGRAEILKFMTGRIMDMRSRMPRAFHTLVKGNVEVKRLPLAEEPGAPGAYGGAGSIDGTVPGRVWLNLRTTLLHSRFSLPTLAYHEGIPGHAWQGEYTFKLPLVRSLLSFNAYTEGWALYAEQLGAELGAYDEDPIGRLGYLQSLAFRACRLVVDTGLHAKKWTRSQAIEWFATANGSSVEEVSGEVDRYCSWPGQACGYKLGHTEINTLRTKTQKALGPRYDFKAFNDAVVLGGSVPLTVLESVIDRHIASRRA